MGCLLNSLEIKIPFIIYSRGRYSQNTSDAMQPRFKFFVFIFLKILFIYSWETQRGRDIGKGRSRLPVGTWCGTWSQDPGITTWAEGRYLTTEPPRCPPSIPPCKGNCPYLLWFQSPLGCGRWLLGAFCLVYLVCLNVGVIRISPVYSWAHLRLGFEDSMGVRNHHLITLLFSG